MKVFLPIFLLFALLGFVNADVQNCTLTQQTVDYLSDIIVNKTVSTTTNPTFGAKINHIDNYIGLREFFYLEDFSFEDEEYSFFDGQVIYVKAQNTDFLLRDLILVVDGSYVSIYGLVYEELYALPLFVIQSS